MAEDPEARARRSRSRGAPPRHATACSGFIGLDFDCTITVRHFYKCLACGIVMGKPSAHPHCRDFVAWLRKAGVTDLSVHQAPDVHPIILAVEALAKRLGEPKFKQMLREVFFGGEARIKLLTAWFTAKKSEGACFAIITAGVASSVSMALEAVPEWDDFFPTDLVLDVGACRHQVMSVTGQKSLMLRDLRPTIPRILLVDDSLGEDPPPAWVLRRSQVIPVALPYEGQGLDDESLARHPALVAWCPHALRRSAMSWNGWGWPWQQQTWGSNNWWSRPSEPYGDWWSQSKATEELGHRVSGDREQSKAFMQQEGGPSSAAATSENPDPRPRVAKPSPPETAENLRSTPQLDAVTPESFSSPPASTASHLRDHSVSQRTKTDLKPETNLPQSLEESEWWLGVDEATRQRLTEELRDWLRSISPTFTCYFQIMEENYDTVDQICRLYLIEEEDGESKNDKRLDPLFFQDNGINDPEHQRLFRQWFASKFSLTADESKAADPAIPPEFTSKAEQVAAQPALVHDARGISAAASSSARGEDPWTTGKDPWAQGREAASFRSRSQPVRSARGRSPGSPGARASELQQRGSARAASRPAMSHAGPAAVRAAAPNQMLPTGTAVAPPVPAAKSADGAVKGQREAANPEPLEQGGPKGPGQTALHGNYSHWGDSAWSPQWSTWSWSWNGWGTPSGW
ncbi:unnamed protein product [Symbiodinium sp. CCMP2592]|nr:unnamed protein product [Symbiodinium sp. CCMP2592]